MATDMIVFGAAGEAKLVICGIILAVCLAVSLVSGLINLVLWMATPAGDGEREDINDNYGLSDSRP